MDFNHVQLPKKDVKVSSLRSSRPASPDIAAAAATCDSGSNTPPWPTCNLKRHLSGAAATAAVNKRKLEQAVIAAAATAVTNNSPSNAAVTMTTVSSTNSIMVSIMIIVVV